MTIEDTAKNMIAENEGRIDDALAILRMYARSVKSHIRYIVAALCDVDADDLVNDTRSYDIRHARWMYWYAYRTLTNESFGSMSVCCSDRTKFTSTCICSGVSKMSFMIEEGGLWAKRWSLIRKIIKMETECEDSEEDNATVTITAPKNVDIKIKKQ